MTIVNWIQVVIFILMVMIGGLIKRISRKKVRGLEGIRGMLKGEEEYKSGSIVGKFGE